MDILGVILGFVLGIAASEFYRWKDIKREKRNYLTSLAKFILEVSIQIGEAEKEMGLEKYEELSKYIRCDMPRWQKEYKFSKERNSLIDDVYKNLDEFIGNLIDYSNYYRYKKNNDSFYITNKIIIEERLKNSKDELNRSKMVFSEQSNCIYEKSL